MSNFSDGVGMSTNETVGFSSLHDVGIRANGTGHESLTCVAFSQDLEHICRLFATEIVVLGQTAREVLQRLNCTATTKGLVGAEQSGG